MSHGASRYYSAAIFEVQQKLESLNREQSCFLYGIEELQPGIVISIENNPASLGSHGSNCERNHAFNWFFDQALLEVMIRVFSNSISNIILLTFKAKIPTFDFVQY